MCAVENGIQALKRLSEYKIDLIILDSKMPEMDGLTFLNELSITEYINVEIIILSGYSDFSFAKQALQFKVNSYLTKPVDEDELCVLLKEIRNRLDKEHEQIERIKNEETVIALRVIYHTNSVISNLGNYGVLTIIPASLDENSDESTYDVITNTTVDLLGKVCFKHRGFVHSLLVNQSIINKFRSVDLLITSLKNEFNKQKLSVEIFYDESVLTSKQASFKSTYDNYFQSISTELFYRNVTIDTEEDGNEYSVYLNEILRGIETTSIHDLKPIIMQFFNCVNRSRLSFSEIVKLTDKIYYLLENLIVSSENDEKRVIERLMFLDSNLFIDFETWCDYVSSQFTETAIHINGSTDKTNRNLCNPIIEYVNVNFDKTITIKEVASTFYLNSSYLGRIFKKTTGVSFNKYINDLRVEKSKKMLIQTDAKIYEISNKLGYSESKYFIAKFTQAVGVTPGEYRKNAFQNKVSRGIENGTD